MLRTPALPPLIGVGNGRVGIKGSCRACVPLHVPPALRSAADHHPHMRHEASWRTSHVSWPPVGAPIC
jgi:hypothetical protein